MRMRLFYVSNVRDLLNAIAGVNNGVYPRKHKFYLYDYMNSNDPYNPKDALAFNMKVAFRNTYVLPSTQLGVRTKKMERQYLDSQATVDLPQTKEQMSKALRTMIGIVNISDIKYGYQRKWAI